MYVVSDINDLPVRIIGFTSDGKFKELRVCARDKNNSYVRILSVSSDDPTLVVRTDIITSASGTFRDTHRTEATFEAQSSAGPQCFTFDGETVTEVMVPNDTLPFDKLPFREAFQGQFTH